MINYYIIDLETDGLSRSINSIVELSVIRCSDKKQLTRTIKSENPMKANLKSLEITGRVLDDIKQGDDLKQTLIDFVAFINQDGLTPKSRCLVGHNIIKFDKPFLIDKFERFAMKLPFDLYFDTMKFMHLYLKEKGIKDSIKLANSCDLLGVKKHAAVKNGVEVHSAKTDTRTTYNLFSHIKDVLKVDMVDYLENLPHKTAEEELSELMASAEEDNDSEENDE